MFKVGEFFENHDIWGQRSTLGTGIDDFKLEISKTHKFNAFLTLNTSLLVSILCPLKDRVWFLTRLDFGSLMH